MSKLKTTLFTFLFSFSSQLSAQEEMLIVMQKDTAVEQLSKSEVIDIFMGKYAAFPNGELAVPVEFIGSRELKKIFYKQLINRNLASVNAYWARLKFSGRKRTVVDKETINDVISYLEKNPLAIGYIPASAMTSGLKVVYRLNE
ncbi:hypothetical protein [Thalassotalea atypica]|uniref:hypothetical protein n=1 Tax=Thalassotalea atypica TaxID=2054316 RepID=UPI0025743EAB|nr:hypothetical protein [Thalassotalea atypica]